MNQKLKEYLNLLAVSGAVIVLDQWTKWLVREHIPLGTQWLPDSWMWLMPYARFVHWYNTGAAFGMFQNGGMVFAGLAVIVVGAIIYYYPHVEKEDWALKLAMGLQLGGATGNLIDRLTQNFKVTDFISLGTFPVFNIADASISIGVVVLLIGVWLKEIEEKKKKESQLSVNSDQSPVKNDEAVSTEDLK